MSSFSALPLTEPLLRNLESLSFDSMTEVQSKSLPHVLAGEDLIVQAKTGSGKTAAFALGLLNNLETENFNVQSLVLCPTRELADQVANEIRRLARQISNVKVVTLCGGVSIGPQIGSLEYGAHIVVGTPGRILKHLSKDTLSFKGVSRLVLDEADRMLDMGFEEDIERIIQQTPRNRQTLLFSATYPDNIAELSNRYLNNPKRINAKTRQDDDIIKQRFYAANDKFVGLCQLLRHFRPESSIVFCNTKQDCTYVATKLKQAGFSALPLHGDLEQRERDQSLLRFANRSCSLLVATDVAARGIDIESLDVVLNYDVTRDTEVHIHRSGRTGRAGQRGEVLNLVADNERYRVERLVSAGVIVDMPRFADLPKPADSTSYKPPMETLQIDGGKKAKLRPTDILGALTAGQEISGNDVGKINITHNTSFVAVSRRVANDALQKLQQGKIKKRQFKIRKLG